MSKYLAATLGIVAMLIASPAQWIFVQYDRAKGWVNRRFVQPLASRGGRIQ